MYKKPIIVFEGIEGSGKSTHIKNVERYLLKKKANYIKLREPGGSRFSEKIRNLILNKNSNLDKITDLLLYMAARNENVNKIIKKNYRKKIIIIDRFIDSTIAYQHYGMNLDKNLIIKINKLILNNLKIDYTFLHLINTKNLKKRLSKRKRLNKYDKFNSIFYNKVQKGFLNISKNKKNYLHINSNKSLDLNKKIIINKIESLIK
ncbi:MAG: dTMP kinase [Candidatus Pelagibacter sp. TMED273]|nr:MAG: dTMP kinase [Candidatus Pelagibacter sp. TMED273]|tara:strand:- start:565 stop:1179 length:615 start_codon:yes stop_codon:yes gene_type:complete